MTSPSPGSRALVLALLATFQLTACGSAAPPAAEVDGAPISHDQLAADTAMFDFLTSISGSPCGQPADGETQDSACARLTLTNLIQEELVKHYAAELGVVANPEDVTNAIAQIEGALGGAEALGAQLAERGLTRAELEALAERLLLFNTVEDAVAEESLTDERVQQLYEESLSQYTALEVAHVLVSTQQEAEAVATEATPKNFADLAAERSLDTGSAANGGSLGVMVEAAFGAQFDPTFVQATLALRPGPISEPVQTQFGWHVIYLIRREVTPLEDVRDQIVAAASAETFQTWMQERLRTAKIRVNPRYGMLDRATGEVVPVRSTNTDGPFVPPASAAPSVAP
ncbi:MAG: peptidylprolyl isomerase [Actinomycetota bacterium]